MNKIQITVAEEEAKNELEAIYAERFDVDVNKVYVKIEETEKFLGQQICNGSEVLCQFSKLLEALKSTSGRLQAIKAVRSCTKVGLYEAKQFIEAFPFLENKSK